jgi:Ca-activated chloride channel family protein
LNLNALSQDRAITLSDEGKKKEAVEELKSSVRRLRQAGKNYNDKALLEKADEMEAQAGQIEREGMTKKSRKVLRTESYQMKQQQMNQ